ncbi:MAG: SRPBCC family protein [Gemmatimonadota bacterium]|nr:SRPBCC family protein [Gemmatimonadota bacterium]
MAERIYGHYYRETGRRYVKRISAGNETRSAAIDLTRRIHMWQGRYETTTDVSADRLYRVITDVNNWNRWDAGIEFTKLEGEVRKGASFILKPKGGPNVKMSIEEIRPFQFVDIAHLFLTRMRTSHEYIQNGNQTTIRFKVEVRGVLGFLWKRIVAENQIREAPAQTASFINYARLMPDSLSTPDGPAAG